MEWWQISLITIYIMIVLICFLLMRQVGGEGLLISMFSSLFWPILLCWSFFNT